MKRGKSRIKTRKLGERDPLKHGTIWRAAKSLPCVGLKWERGHRCGRGHTAHHDPPVSRGGNDLTGLIVCCETLHAPLDNRSLRETRSELLARLKITEDDLREEALGTVEKAKAIAGLGGGLDF